MSADIEGYREYVVARLDPLRRMAYLLCGDWHTADDLVSIALSKLFRHWRRMSTMDSPDAYVRRVVLRAWLDERRRPWRRESAWESVPDRAVERPGTDGVADRLTILALLAELPPRRRAVLVLRYFCDCPSRRRRWNSAAPLLTVEQIIAIGRHPGLTLYP